jgi:hypothetical protein
MSLVKYERRNQEIPKTLNYLFIYLFIYFIIIFLYTNFGLYTTT